ncbi:MAG: hypothetical protein NTV96_10395 [Actinobacteria bacterium]|nr:hypothetical protein [Actinomycetota bacterium]
MRIQGVAKALQVAFALAVGAVLVACSSAAPQLLAKGDASSDFPNGPFTSKFTGPYSNSSGNNALLLQNWDDKIRIDTFKYLGTTVLNAPMTSAILSILTERKELFCKYRVPQTDLDRQYCQDLSRAAIFGEKNFLGTFVELDNEVADNVGTRSIEYCVQDTANGSRNCAGQSFGGADAWVDVQCEKKVEGMHTCSARRS